MESHFDLVRKTLDNVKTTLTLIASLATILYLAWDISGHNSSSLVIISMMLIIYVTVLFAFLQSKTIAAMKSEISQLKELLARKPIENEALALQEVKTMANITKEAVKHKLDPDVVEKLGLATEKPSEHETHEKA